MPISKLVNVNPSRWMIVWEIDELEDLLVDLLGSFNSEELNSIKAPTKRLEWLASRLAVKHLCQELGIDYIGISKDENGKPSIINSNYELALSHSYPYVAAILDVTLDVGIDLEQPKDKLLKLAHKFASQEELEFCTVNPAMLCIIWSAKETLYKIYSKRGLDFKDHMRIECFELQPNGTITGEISKADYNKSFKLHYEVNDDHVLVYNLD